MDYFIEALIVIFSSTGIIGTVIATVITKILNSAKADAEARRTERQTAERLKSLHDEKSDELLLSVSLFCRGLISEEELLRSENSFNESLKEQNRFNRESNNKLLSDRK